MLDVREQRIIPADFVSIPVQKSNEAFKRIVKSNVKCRFSINMAS